MRKYARQFGFAGCILTNFHRMPIDLDLYFPVFTVLQFFFFMGLLKVQQITQNKSMKIPIFDVEQDDRADLVLIMIMIMLIPIPR